MINNPSLYEINTRVWIRQFDTTEKQAAFDDIPLSYWDDLKSKGIDYVWLMGIWKTDESTIEQYNFDEGLVKEYSKALKDWKREDVIGSPYSIDVYDVNPKLGNLKSLYKIRTELNKRKMKLILDFVPNHFSSHSSLIKTNPDLFLSTTENYFKEDPHTFFKPDKNDSHVFAHGRDPFYPAWQDTAQVNYFSIKAREFMIKTLINLTKFCDGVRCDMAMLSLNNVFKNTWGGVLAKNGYETPKDEFWKLAIEIVKNTCSNFIFIAEAYWDLEYELQQHGFDFTYDKKLTDRLKVGYVPEIRDHLTAQKDYQRKSIRFLENHDEERAAKILGKEKSQAAAVIAGTVTGMHFYYDGQFEGKKTKLPVQLGREPKEQICPSLKLFYDRFLDITNRDVFKHGEWNMLKPIPSSDKNTTYNNILAWTWTYANEKRLIVINYADTISTCWLKLDVRGYPEEFTLIDLLTDKIYDRSAEEVHSTGLYIELRNYNSHIFAY